MVPEILVSKWPQARRTGWKVFCHVLRLSQNEWKPQPPPESAMVSPMNGFRSIYSDFIEGNSEEIIGDELRAIDFNDEDDGDDGDDRRAEYYELKQGEGLPAYCPQHSGSLYQGNYFRRNKYLSTLWAAAQTELLTYRRLQEGDSWISKNFDMESLLQNLEIGSPLSIGLISKKMMKSFCRCGIFYGSDDVACLRVEEASANYFSNLEDWSRTTFLGAHQRHEEWDGY
jgi:hypothetical protein